MNYLDFWMAKYQAGFIVLLILIGGLFLIFGLIYLASKIEDLIKRIWKKR